MKAKEHLFDISTKEKRRETIGYISYILYEIYLLEEENIQEMIFENESAGNDENHEIDEIAHVMDELIDIVVDLANLYD